MASTKEDLIREDPLAPKLDEVVDENENSQDEDRDEEGDDEEIEDEETDEDEGDDDSEDDDSDEDDDESDDEEEDDSEDEDDEPDFKKRFTQIKGDTKEEYLENLETAYNESSAEGIRLNKEHKELQSKMDTLLGAIMNDKDLTEALEKKLGAQQAKGVTSDPAIEYARSNVEAQWKKEWSDFAEANPELTSDKALHEKVVSTLAAVEKSVKETEGRTLGMKEGLDIVAGILKLNQPTKEDKIRMAAKKQAAGKSSTGSRKKSKPKANVTDKAMQLAKRFGYTEDQVRKFNS